MPSALPSESSAGANTAALIAARGQPRRRAARCRSSACSRCRRARRRGSRRPMRRCSCPGGWPCPSCANCRQRELGRERQREAVAAVTSNSTSPFAAGVSFAARLSGPRRMTRAHRAVGAELRLRPSSAGSATGPVSLRFFAKMRATRKLSPRTFAPTHRADRCLRHRDAARARCALNAFLSLEQRAKLADRRALERSWSRRRRSRSRG